MVFFAPLRFVLRSLGVALRLVSVVTPDLKARLRLRPLSRFEELLDTFSSSCLGVARLFRF